MSQQIELKVSGVDVAISYANEHDQPVTQREIEAYLDRAHAQHPGQVLQSLKLDVDGEDVGISYGHDGSLERCQDGRGVGSRQARPLPRGSRFHLLERLLASPQRTRAPRSGRPAFLRASASRGSLSSPVASPA